MTDTEKVEIVRGSGNAFRDCDMANADVLQAKAKLAAQIIAALDASGTSARQAAKSTGFAAADFSRIRNADLGRFTIDRMIKMLGGIDARAQVTLTVKTRPKFRVRTKAGGVVSTGL